jgi:energy-coupling factor transport system ATP-binding protein
MNPDIIMKVSHLCFRFSPDESWVLKDLSFVLKSNQTVLLMGPSGCGKSTLAFLLAGLYPEYAGETEGTINCQDGEIKDLKPDIRARQVSIVFQNPDDQFAMETAEGEVFFALENINYQGDYQHRASELLSLVGLADFEKRKILTLSGGEKQKLSIATALATEPKLLILDEPLANLDQESSKEITLTLKQLASGNLTLFIIDHRPEPWIDWLDRIILLDRQGQPVRLDLNPQEAREHLELFNRLSIFSPGYHHAPELRNHLPSLVKSEPTLKATRLNLNLGHRIIWEEVSLTADKGTITAILGENGSGKSSLLMVLAGLIKAKGQIELKGSPGLIFQNPGFQFLTQKVLSEIILSLFPQVRGKIKPDLIEKSLELAAEFGLADMVERSPWQLSQGQQRCLAVLTMLAAKKDILLLDEPTYAQDQRSTELIMAMLMARVRKGLTAIMVTHDLDLAQAYADEILVLQQKSLRTYHNQQFPIPG